VTNNNIAFLMYHDRPADHARARCSFSLRRFAEIRVLPGTNPNSTLAGRYGELLPPAGVEFMEKCLKMVRVGTRSGSRYSEAFELTATVPSRLDSTGPR
jgi:hypothetical protein